MSTSPMVPTESGVERLQPTRPTARARAQTSAMSFFFISVLLVNLFFAGVFLRRGGKDVCHRLEDALQQFQRLFVDL